MFVSQVFTGEVRAVFIDNGLAGKDFASSSACEEMKINDNFDVFLLVFIIDEFVATTTAYENNQVDNNRNSLILVKIYRNQSNICSVLT